MDSQMIEPLLIRVRELEKANRRWKMLCATLLTIVLAVVIPGTVFMGYFALNHQRRVAIEIEQARMMELVAREQAEVARLEAMRALEDAQNLQKKE